MGVVGHAQLVVTSVQQTSYCSSAMGAVKMAD